MHQRILQLDIQGTPQRWITLQQAALHYATDTVAWVDGEAPLRTLRGGFNAATGRQSTLDVRPIVALRGAPRINLFHVTPSFARTFCSKAGTSAPTCTSGWPHARRRARA